MLKKKDMIIKNMVDQVRAERDILCATRSPYVVRCFYSFTSEHNLYMVMEYHNGGDCAALIQVRAMPPQASKDAIIVQSPCVMSVGKVFSMGYCSRVGESVDHVVCTTREHQEHHRACCAKKGRRWHSHQLHPRGELRDLASRSLRTLEEFKSLITGRYPSC